MIRFRIVNFCLLLMLLPRAAGYCQLYLFPADAHSFNPAGADSVFFFSSDLAVTAFGADLSRLKYADGSISGDGIPNTLKLRQPLGAYVYRPDRRAGNVPCIFTRSGRLLPFAAAVRREVLGFKVFAGRSSKDGTAVTVWQKEPLGRSARLYFGNGVSMPAADWPKAFRSASGAAKIAGIWVDPPETEISSVPELCAAQLRLAPLLVVFIDGLGWKEYERAVLQTGTVFPEMTTVMAAALYPPVTKINYRAMIYGRGEENIFQIMSRLGLEYTVLEGEKMIYPVPGSLTLHRHDDPVTKDSLVFADALAQMRKAPALIWTHFHGLDDLNHELGPKDPVTRAHLLRLLRYFLTLKERWPGRVMLVADHGAHMLGSREAAAGSGRGGHGDFCFSDMAVPLMFPAGSHNDSGAAPPLSQPQADSLEALLFTAFARPAAAAEEDTGAVLLFIAGADTLTVDRYDGHLFRNDFQFSYVKKGRPVSGTFQGAALLSTADSLGLDRPVTVTARSADGHTVIFSASADDLESLVIRFEPDPDSFRETFSLYPLQDRFPNRIVKYLTTLIVE